MAVRPALNEVRLLVGAFLRQAYAVEQREAASVASIDAYERAWMPAETDHLLEDRQHHEVAEAEPLTLRQLDEDAAPLERDRDDLGVADVRRQAGLDVMRTDD